ncbi:MAG: hypothetical protein WC107_00400 [Patescibacteria group bacterium]
MITQQLALILQLVTRDHGKVLNPSPHFIFCGQDKKTVLPLGRIFFNHIFFKERGDQNENFIYF